MASRKCWSSGSKSKDMVSLLHSLCLIVSCLCSSGIVKQQIAQDDGIGMLGSVRGKCQGHRSLFRQLPQSCQGCLPGLRGQLGLVPAAKLGEFLRVMPKPGARLAAGGNLLQPEVNVRPLFGEPARPEP